MDRQKILLIFAGAWVSAALLTWFLYASTKAPKVEKTVAIQAAARDMPAGTRLRKGDLRTVHVAEKDAPRTAIADEKLALDRPLLFPVSANEPLTSSKIASATGAEGLPATIEIGKRAVSVPITDANGVAGLIQPRAHVDVLFTKTGTMAEAVTTTILEDVIVLAMGRTTEVTAASATTAARPQNQAATLLVTPEEARKLEFAKNQGKISLALRNPLDQSAASDNAATTSQALFGKRTPDLRNDKLWAKLTGVEPEKPKPPPPPPPPVVEKKEPPKPKTVVDVFRGDKHVQEVFQ